MDGSIKNFQCLPNPVVSNCNFYFEHNQSSTFLKINIIIYDMLGNKIKKIKRTFDGQSSRIGPILWNLREETNIIDGGISKPNVPEPAKLPSKIFSG